MTSEVRIGLDGPINQAPFPAIGYLLNEIGPSAGGDALEARVYEDAQKMRVVKAEKNISLFLGFMISGSITEDGFIRSVTVTDVETYSKIIIEAPLFADCTDDAELASLSGADCQIEDEISGTVAPVGKTGKPQNVLFSRIIENGMESTFPKLDCKDLYEDEKEPERKRDLELYKVYSQFSSLKNDPSRAEEYHLKKLEWLGYVLGRKTGRRILGDIVLSEGNIKDHYTDECITTRDRVSIPYRSLFSRSVRNLFMAGRCISAKLNPESGVWAARTGGMEGEVVGLAASVCQTENCLPKDIFPAHWSRLEELMLRGAGRTDIPYTQTYGL